MAQWKNYLGPIYLITASALWGGLYVVSKVVLDVLDPLPLLWLRYLIAIAALVLMGLKMGESWRIRKKDIPLIIFMGIIGYALSIWAQFAGVQLSTAQTGAVITSAAPIFMVFFARIFLKETITMRKLAAVIIAPIGVILIVGVDSVDASARLGAMLLVVAAVAWSLMSVLIKKLPPEYSAVTVTTYAMAAAFVFLTPPVLPMMDGAMLQTVLHVPTLLSILYIAVLSTSVAFSLWNKGMQMVDASTGGIYLFFQPVTGTLLGWFFLGETVGLAFVLGTILILGGVLLIVRK